MKKLLDISLDIGEEMILAGAEVHRVEDTLTRICTALGAKRVDVFITHSSMMATIHDDSGNPYTQTRRTFSVGNNFNKLSKLNALSRKICSNNLTYSQIQNELELIKSDKPYSFLMECLFSVLIAWSFTLFFGGGFIESIFGAIISFLVKCSATLVDNFLNNKIFSKFISSFILTALSFLALSLKFIPTVDYVIIGNIMTLIPGVNFTNSLRDLFTGDSMTGVLRFIESLLTALAIALGYVVFIYISGNNSFNTTSFVEYKGFKLVQVVTGIIGSLGFAGLYNCKGKTLIAVSFGGGIAWAIHLLLVSLSISQTLSYLIVSLIISIYAEFLARLLKSPTTVFISPSLIPLVPGASLYYTMRSMFGNDVLNFSSTAIQTLELSAALAFGVILATVVMKIYNIIISKIRR